MKRKKKNEATVNRSVLENHGGITVERLWVVGCEGSDRVASCDIWWRICGGPCCYLLINIVFLLCTLNARMLPATCELGKRGSRAGSSRTDTMNVKMNLPVDTGASSLSDDRDSSPVGEMNEPA
ncbi:hypothetical protein T11_13673 [Trichinella zimbabwensis]|uniref:Uncharacterized protein n=1 Tax=Trichinella zimbabwensis TaxID=268475 RepID=A0A0V1HCT0_9BILA|nr:hypothetical protein T11_13673 [Trichinella zimbabwensis]